MDESADEESAVPDEDSTEPDAVDDEDNLVGDTAWDPEHATPWKPNRRSRRNTSQLSSLRPPPTLQPDKVCESSQGHLHDWADDRLRSSSVSSQRPKEEAAYRSTELSVASMPWHS